MHQRRKPDSLSYDRYGGGGFCPLTDNTDLLRADVDLDETGVNGLVELTESADETYVCVSTCIERGSTEG